MPSSQLCRAGTTNPSSGPASMSGRRMRGWVRLGKTRGAETDAASRTSCSARGRSAFRPFSGGPSVSAVGVWAPGAWLRGGPSLRASHAPGDPARARWSHADGPGGSAPCRGGPHVPTYRPSPAWASESASGIAKQLRGGKQGRRSVRFLGFLEASRIDVSAGAVPEAAIMPAQRSRTARSIISAPVSAVSFAWSNSHGSKKSGTFQCE